MTSVTWSWKDIAALALLTAVALLPRLLFLGADPPQDFATGWLADEGAWAHNARQHFLFGRWILDEANPGLFAAPLYTFALEGWYRLVGIGLVQTRLLSALAGALTCVVFYLGLRARAGRGRSLGAALLLAGSWLLLTHNRVGLTESFQLLIVTAMAALLLRAADRPRLAVLAGLCFVLALLAKPSAILMAPVLAVYWLVRFLNGRRDPTRGLDLREPGYFAGSAVLAALLAVVLLVLPNREAIFGQLEISLRNVYGGEAQGSGRRVPLFGLELIGFAADGFFLQCATLLLPVLVFAVVRLGRGARQATGVEEILAWCWLGVGLLFLATQRYQPERRFVILLPALALLMATAIGSGGLAVPGRAGWLAAGGRWRAAAAGALAGLFGGLYLQAALVRSGMGFLPGTRAQLAALLVSLCVVAGAGLMLLLRPRWPLQPRPLPAWPFVLLFLLSDPLRFGWYLARPQFAGAEAVAGFAEFTRDLPLADRVVVGTSADGLALASRVQAFSIRYRPGPGSYLNLDGWEKLNPSLAVVAAPPGRLPFDLEQQRILAEARRRGFVPVTRYVTRYDGEGRVAFEAVVYGRPRPEEN